MIPQDIKDKIREKYNQTFAGAMLVQAAEFGYSLASPKQDEQELWDEVLSEILITTGRSVEHIRRVNLAISELKSKFTITRNPIK